MPEPEHIIQAICNDPRHARGKVAKVATFGRFTFPHGEVRWLILDAGEWRYTRPDPTGVYRRYGAHDEDRGSTYVWPCKLCPRSLEVTEITLRRVLEDTYQGLLKTTGNERVSQVPITVLRQVASRQPR